jgi:hypothetical protein
LAFLSIPGTSGRRKQLAMSGKRGRECCRKCELAETSSFCEAFRRDSHLAAKRGDLLFSKLSFLNFESRLLIFQEQNGIAYCSFNCELRNISSFINFEASWPINHLNACS